jgi:hypothetical protein
MDPYKSAASQARSAASGSEQSNKEERLRSLRVCCSRQPGSVRRRAIPDARSCAARDSLLPCVSIPLGAYAETTSMLLCRQTSLQACAETTPIRLGRQTSLHFCAETTGDPTQPAPFDQ